MSSSDSSLLKSTGAQATRHRTPETPLGWWAIGLSVLGLAAGVVLPMISMTFRETYPVTDTWVMPVIWRSVLNIVAVALIVPTALFVTFMVVGEGLASV
jgi:hypothetical protein